MIRDKHETVKGKRRGASLQNEAARKRRFGSDDEPGARINYFGPFLLLA
jgi:hypothetical protein